MPSRSRAEAVDVDDRQSEKPRGTKKPRKRSKPRQKKGLHTGAEVPFNVAQSPDSMDGMPPEAANRSPGGDAVAPPSDEETADASTEPAPSSSGAVAWPGSEDEPGWADTPAPDAPTSAWPPTVDESWTETEHASVIAKDRGSEEPAMNEDTKQHVRARETWIRLVYMILFGVVFYVGQFVVGLVAVVQFLLKLLTGAPHARLVAFGAEMAVFYREIVEFLSFHSERIPFPFSPWPRSAVSGGGSGSDAREVVHN
jgi:hypothetical protein